MYTGYIHMCYYLIASTDYPTNPGTVVFEAGSTSEMTEELRVQRDDIFETNETYVLTLFVPRRTEFNTYGH